MFRSLLLCLWLVASVQGGCFFGFSVHSLETDEDKKSVCNIDGHIVEEGQEIVLEDCYMCHCREEGYICCKEEEDDIDIPLGHVIVHDDNCTYHFKPTVP